MRLRTYLMVAMSAVLTLSNAARAEPALTAPQQKIVDDANAGLDAVETDLGAARSKLDSGDTAGATETYSTAVKNYNKHISGFAKLPANHSAVVALRKKASDLGLKLKETATALRAAPKQAEKPGDTPAGAGAPATTKLDYRGQQSLKDARFYLNEAESRVTRLSELTAGTIDADAIRESGDLMSFVKQRLGYTSDRLKALPADQPEVAVEQKRYDDLLAKLTAAEKAIEKAKPDAEKQTAELGEQMTDDLAMVESWSEMLRDPQYLFRKPEDAIAAVGQLPQMRAALADMLQRWTARAQAKPNDRATADTVGRLKFTEEHLTALETHTKELAKTLPEQIKTELAEVNTMIQTATTERRPLYFGPEGGIAGKTKFVEEHVQILEAIDPAAGQSAKQSLDETRASAQTAQKSLAQEIIKGNTKPEERYNGADVEDLRQQVIATWKAAHPDTEIVAVIFNTEGWNRTTRWDWSEGSKAFYKVDFDRIQPKLFYKHNDTQAVEVPVEIYKDHMKEDRIAVKPWDMEKEPSVTSIYLLDALK